MVSVAFRYAVTTAGSFILLTTYYKISLSLQLSQYCGFECFLNIKLFSKLKVTF